MDYYTKFNQTIAKKEGEDDPISYEPLLLLKKNSHPRSSISIRRPNGTPYFYNTDTITQIINNGDKKDPFTRLPLNKPTLERARLYNLCLQKFPDLKTENIDTKQIYTDWITNPTNPDKKLKAQCLLQPSDLVDIFKSYNGKGSSLNRLAAAHELKQKTVGSWLLRNSSVKDTDTKKGYCISVRTDNHTIKHYLIVHKLGCGIYWGVSLDSSVEIPETFQYQKEYANIVDLLTENFM